MTGITSVEDRSRRVAHGPATRGDDGEMAAPRPDDGACGRCMPNAPPDRLPLQRARVLVLGDLLGLPEAGVRLFSAELTGRAWRDCGPEELHAVFVEFLSLLCAVEDRMLRRRANYTREGGGHVDHH